MAGRITVRTVTGLEPGSTFWDGELHGFGVRRRGDAPPTYFVKFRIGSGRAAKQRWHSIGKHGPWTPDAARSRAEVLLREARTGVDPVRALEAARAAPTLAALCDDYLKIVSTLVLPGKGRPKKPSSIQTDRSNIERHIKPLLGKKRANDITKTDVERMQRDIAAGKTARREKTKPRGVADVTGGRGTAARATAVLGAIFSWAVRQAVVSENPVKGVSLLKGAKRERFLSGEERARLGSVLAAAEAEWREWEANCAAAAEQKKPRPTRCGESPIAIAAIRLLAATGCRKMEILGLQWRWVDLEKGVINLPDSKTGAKAILLSPHARAILKAQPQISGCAFVFPGDTPGGHLVGLPRIWERLKARAELPKVRLHDLRHSYAADALMNGESLFMVSRMLGHATVRSTEKYAHLADDPLRAAIDRNAARIEELMSGKGSAET